MEFLFVYERPNGPVTAVLFYVVHLIASLMLVFVLLDAVSGMMNLVLAGRQLALVYSMGLSAFVIRQRNLDPGWYASLAVAAGAAAFMGALGGLILPAFLTTRGV
jgi:hypothetical protein